MIDDASNSQLGVPALIELYQETFADGSDPTLRWGCAAAVLDAAAAVED